MEPRLLLPLINRAFSNAVAKPVTSSTTQQVDSERSRHWVEALAAEFRSAYAQDSSVLAFSKFHDVHRLEFGLNELLYDVCVCRTATVPSCRGHRELHYVTQVLWQVESEFAHDSRQALYDFNKLVLGSAERKLFIGPIVHDCDAFLNVLAAPAAHCTGEVYAALLPAPGSWPSAQAPRLVRFDSGHWEPIHS